MGFNNKFHLLFVEDPGAISLFIPIIEKFNKLRIHYKLFVDGYAIDYFKNFKDFKIDYTKLDQNNFKKLRWSKIQTVIVGTSENKNSLAFLLIKSAEENKISSIGMIDSHINSSYRFKSDSNDPLKYKPKYLMLPNEIALLNFHNLGIKKSSMFVIGHPFSNQKKITFNRNRLIRNLLPKEALNKTIIIFVSELSIGLNSKDFIKSDEYKLQGRGSSKYRTNIVIEEFLDSITRLSKNKSLNIFKVLRKHPKEDKDSLSEYSKEFDFISTGGNPEELVYIADLVIGMSSALLSQSIYQGTPTLSIIPSIKEIDWLPENILNNQLFAGTREQIDFKIKKLLSLKRKDFLSDYEIQFKSTEFADSFMEVLKKIEVANI